MHIIFGYITNWSLPIIKLLKFLKFNVYYIYIEEINLKKKNEIALNLKENNIYPLPLEKEKKISSLASFSLCETDPNEIAYKKNMELISDDLLKKYSSAFSVNRVKKLRLLIQDFIFYQQMLIFGKLGIWSALYPKTKIVYISFKFRCFYNSNTGENIYKIIIPLDFVNFLKKILKVKNDSFKKDEKYKDNNLNELINKKVAFIPHKGIYYGSKSSMLFEKSLYYSDNINSSLHKNKILHLDYSNFSKPEKDMCWISINKIKVPNFQIINKTILNGIKNIYLIRSWSTFLVWLLLTHRYNSFLKYDFIVKKFKNLKLAILDYDILCPKTLVLALNKNKVKTVATQERFIHTFYSSYATVCVDTYFTISEYTANTIAKSKYFDVNDLIPIGFYRSKYLSFYKNEDTPKEILVPKSDGKKIIVMLGYDPPKNWHESYTSLQSNWSSQVSFLQDAIKLSKNLTNVFLIIKYKAFECPLRSNPYFKNIIDEINGLENIIISNNYSEAYYSYKLCSNANLVIAKHTSIGDECLSSDIPVLFYEYTHNMKGIQSDAFNYSQSGLMCYEPKELIERSKSILFDKTSRFKNEIYKLKQQIYYVKDAGNIKNKILNKLENLARTV